MASAEKAKEAVRVARDTPIAFNAVAVSDGITKGTECIHGPLVSRDAIADSIERFSRRA
jgi:dihydroxyacid dehydratase/phosphogluconate dehydratase